MYNCCTIHEKLQILIQIFSMGVPNPKFQLYCMFVFMIQRIYMMHDQQNILCLRKLKETKNRLIYLNENETNFSKKLN